MNDLHSSNADIHLDSIVSPSAQIWSYSQIREGAAIGSNVVIGRGVYIDTGVVIGPNSKVQNGSQIYGPAVVEQGVFIGPEVVFTNDRVPRAVNPDFTQKTAMDWNREGVTVGQGASVGARSVCVAPVRIGQWSMVAAGSVVTKDVPAFALVAGVPARRIGWVDRQGLRLIRGSRRNQWVSSVGEIFVEREPDLIVPINEDGQSY